MSPFTGKFVYRPHYTAARADFASLGGVCVCGLLDACLAGSGLCSCLVQSSLPKSHAAERSDFVEQVGKSDRWPSLLELPPEHCAERFPFLPCHALNRSK